MRGLTQTVVAVFLTGAVLFGPAASAQTLTPVAAHYGAAASLDTLPRATYVSGGESDLDPSARIGLGVLGGFAGAFAGGLFGAAAGGGCHGDMCGLGYFLGGAAIGSVAFASVVSAMPTFGSKCTEGTRELRAVGGSVTGALVGGALGLLGGPVSILTYIVGSGVGAGVGAASC